MSYFQNFPLVYYNFGDKEPLSLFQNITSYIDLVDQLSDQVNFYETYTIKEAERPDTLSYQLYNDPQYYWTFYLLNPKLRESGWPLTNQEFEKYIKEAYPYWTVTTEQDISNTIFKKGTFVVGNTSGTDGNIIEVNLELGQLVIDTKGTKIRTTEEPEYELFDVLTEDETLRKYVDLSNVAWWRSEYSLYSALEVFHSDPANLIRPSNRVGRWRTQDNKIYLKDSQPQDVDQVWVKYQYEFFSNDNFAKQETLTFGERARDLEDVDIIKSSKQYNAIHHYENADGEWVDIFDEDTGLPDYSLTTSLTPVTFYDRARERNTDLKQIKILKADVVSQVSAEFSKLLES